MKILGIDSSAKAASVAITDGEKVLGSVFTNTGLTHSQTLMPMLENLLKSCNTTLDDIDLVAVNKGPGSFTGIRIGVAAAKGIADVKKIPVYGASTLGSMAYNLIDTDCVVLCAMDARCNQVYNAFFDISDGKVTRLTEDNADSVENVIKKLKNFKKNKIIVGDGAEICYNSLNGDSAVRLAHSRNRFQSAVGVCLEALHMPNEAYIDSAALVPEYLRLPQAQRELNNKLQKGV